MDLDPRLARRNAALGVTVLAARTVVTQGIALVGTVVLLRVLRPEDLGTFAVLQFILTFLQFFGDAGIGGALIQGRQEPTRDALANVFTFQGILGMVLVAVAWLAAPAIREVWPGLPESAPTLLRAMAFAFLLTALRGVPSILLERRLRFGAVAGLEVAQTATFYVVACASAMNGLGDWTWPLAVLAQAGVGTLLAFVVQPWRPALALDMVILRPLVRFGLPFQTKNIVGFANGAVTPLFGGAVLGPSAVGLVNWGQQLAHMPLRLVEVIARVAFPLFARIQNDREELGRVMERALQVGAAGAFFGASVFLTVGPNIAVIVFSKEWIPALPALYAFSAVLCIGFVSPIAGAAFDAMGRPGVMARLAVAWTVLNWIVVPLTTWKWGLEGFILGSCVHVVAGNAAVLWLLRREIPEMRILAPLWAPALGAMGSALTGWFLLRPWATSPLRLAVGLAIAFLVYAGIFAVADRQAIAIARHLLAGEPTTRPP